jgi:hypothetical protein
MHTQHIRNTSKCVITRHLSPESVATHHGTRLLREALRSSWVVVDIVYRVIVSSASVKDCRTRAHVSSRDQFTGAPRF